MKKLISLLALSVVLSSCEKEIDYQIPNPGDKIVVSSRLESGKEPVFYISTSVYSMLAQNPKTSDIFSAKLFTDDPNSPFELQSQLDSNNSFDPLYFYTTTHLVSAGKNYRLEVSAPGLEPVSAQTTVPEITALENVRFDTVTRDLRFSFTDNANKANFYYIELQAADLEYNLWFSTVDPSLEFFEFSEDPFGGDGDGRSYGSEAFLDDDQFNGQRKEVNLRIEEFNTDGQFYVYLYSISESFYRFRLTRAAGDFSGGFFSEPVQLFSNVQGGYGIMAGLSYSRILVTL